MAKKSHTKDKVTAYGKAIMAELEQVKGKPYVKVGFPTNAFGKAKKERTPEGKAKVAIDSGLTVGEVAVFNEFGTTTGIPERSFIRSTFDANKEAYKELSADLKRKVLKRNMTTKRAMGLLGQKMKADIIKKIDSNIPPQNSEETRAKKGSSHTLIDTGQMRQSVTYEVGGADIKKEE